MIVRILGEPQRILPDTALDELNALDRVAELAVDVGDQRAFSSALLELLAAVRRLGAPVADDVLVPSDLVLPPPDATVGEVRALFDDDGMVPG